MPGAFAFLRAGLLQIPSADQFHLNPPVFRAAFLGLVIGYGRLLALAFGVDPVGGNAFTHQIGLDCRCTALR